MNLIEQLARTDERISISRFLTKYSHLRALAQMIEDGVHVMPDSAVREYCRQRGILVR